jgi:bifunctional oligoribonuclease and PAP phosphatase NrnA
VPSRGALSTHLNADGDGCGSEAALARLLMQRGHAVCASSIPRPGPRCSVPARGGRAKTPARAGEIALREGRSAARARHQRCAAPGYRARRCRAGPRRADRGDRSPHAGRRADRPRHVRDTTACATGELIFDLARTLGLTITHRRRGALYCAILTDTGGFRFSNTSPRCHAVASALLAAGVAPGVDVPAHLRAGEALAPAPAAEALGTLQIDADIGLSWISLPFEVVQRTGAAARTWTARGASALGGRHAAGPHVPRPRARQGQAVVPQHRQRGRAGLARQFGGGGHVKASGALLVGTLDECEPASSTPPARFWPPRRRLKPGPSWARSR